MVIELFLSNAESTDSTCTFNVNIANVDTSKQMTELSNRQDEYVSVLALPLKKNNRQSEYKILSIFRKAF